MKENIIEKLKDNYILLIILFFGAFLRFYHINFQSPWLDELITMIECNPKLSFKDSYEIMSIRENNPLLYYYSVKILGSVFGYSTFVVRMISAIIGIVGIYVIYLLGKEIQNKKTGLIAAVLLTFNYFHIYFSQEARPYGLLTVFTIISFYRLIIFLKSNNLKNCIYYSLAAMLMINTHFFGLFVLVSQAVIIAIFFLDVDKNKRKIYALLAVLSGIITVFLWYIPSWDIFVIATQLKVFWIPAPTPDMISGIFREFFGNSESVLFIVFLLGTYYFIKLFDSKENTNEKIKNRQKTFSFIIILIWIFITIFIPFVRSYLQIPMITSRYVIVVLPAIILLISISINNIENKLLQKTVLGMFVIASLTDIFIVKQYYSKISKTQYKEISEKIIEKNISKSKIVSMWGWHFGYYLNNETQKNEIIQKPLQDYVNELMAKPDGKPFWYVDAHFRPYLLSPEGEKFLTDNYNVIENLEFYDTWAKYYVPKTAAVDTIVLDINQFEPIKSDNAVNLLLFSNSTTKSKPTTLEPGLYRLAIRGKSLPDPPIDGQNANIAVAVDGKEIGSYFLNEKEEKTNYFNFTISQKKDITVDLTFGNDLVVGDKDRNALIFSVSIEKVKK